MLRSSSRQSPLMTEAIKEALVGTQRLLTAIISALITAIITRAR